MIVEHVERMFAALGKSQAVTPEFAGEVFAMLNTASEALKHCISVNGDKSTVEADAAMLWLWTYSETVGATLADVLLPLLQGRQAASSETLRLVVQCWGV